jgi:hypothetical protein
MQNKTNWIAIIASMVVGMAIGFLWYGMLFNQQWMDGNGITMEGEKMFKNGVERPASMMPMVLNALAMIVYGILINWLVNKTSSFTWASGATLGAVIGLITLIGIYIGNLFAGNPLSLTMVDGSYSFVIFTLIGAVVGGWRKS